LLDFLRLLDDLE
jgi:hypothetical protein